MTREHLYARVPLRALVLSMLSLVVPAVAQVAFPEGLGENELLVWLLALVPAFLFAYYRGWRGAATALAAGMAALSLTQAVLRASGGVAPPWPVLLTGLAAFATVALGVGWIAERLHRQRALALRNALDTSLIVDESGAIVYAGPSAPRVLGLASGALVGRRLLELVEDEDAEKVERLLARDGTGSLLPAEVRIRRADGSPRVLELRIADLREDPSVHGFALVARDLTERKRLEERLRRAERMEGIGRLAADVAHEYNNLLTVMQAQLHALEEEVRVPDRARAPLQRIRAAADQAADLTAKLFAFSRQQMLRPAEVRLGEVVRRIEPSLRAKLPPAARLELDLAAEGAITLVDARLFGRMLLTLVDRAAPGLAEGGSLRIEVADDVIDAELAGRYSYAVRTGPYVRVSIEDSGPAIDVEAARLAFEPFATVPGGGRWLGLSSVYGFVKQSGGYVWVAGQEGSGTRFDVFFPSAEGRSLAATGAAAGADGRRGTETVLVVEDDDLVRSVVRDTLLRQGYGVLEAANGKEAIAVARASQGRFDLLVTDMVMPLMGGGELARTLRVRQPDLAILSMSGYAESQINQDLPDSALFLHKPFTPDELARAVRRALDEPSRALAAPAASADRLAAVPAAQSS